MSSESKLQTYTFKGGIHPPGYKSYTHGNVIEMYMDPKRDLVFPMQQHIGAPCTPTVAKGDYVLRGQVIGDSDAYVSAPIHSSVSGTVKDIKLMAAPNGNKVLSVIIENDHLYKEVETMHKPYDYPSMTNDEICKVIRDAGIVGLGGAGFPTHVKLNPGKEIDTIIVNGAECEPFLASDFRLMLEEPTKLISGIKILLQMFPKAKAYIGIEDNKKQVINLMCDLLSGESRINVAKLKTKYPQGAEKQILNAITGRCVPSGKLPADVGCIVINADTVVAVYRAIMEGRPLMRRIVTLSGDAMNCSHTFKVRTGTSLEELIEAAGGLKAEPSKIIAGGPMMGIALSTTDIAISKTTNGALFLTEKLDFCGEESACIRCGRCISACPMHLLPLELTKFALHHDLEEFEKFHGMDCMECGSCAFVCPAKRHLTQTFKAAKKAIADNRKKGGAKNG